MKEFEPPAAEFLGLPGKLLVEHKYAMTKGFTPTEFFADDVWLRVVCDAGKINPPVAYAWDWKTGNIKPESVQLGLTATVMFAHHPEVTAVVTDFRWLKEGPEIKTREGFTRGDMKMFWTGVLPRVQKMEQAFLRQDFPPTPGRLCMKYCPVESCPFWKKGTSR
jgi:hypothetical protein